MATKMEKIQDLLGGIEEDVRKATIRDILGDLKDFLTDGVPAEEKAGMKAAIEIIKANYPI
jgi:hypothetical protein